MGTVEAAASLFGPDEPTSDPFAALGEDTAPALHSQTDDFFDTRHTDNTADFFNAPQENSSLIGGEAAHPLEATWSIAPTAEYGQPSYSHDSDAVGASYNQVQGNDPYSQQNTYPSHAYKPYEPHANEPHTYEPPALIPSAEDHVQQQHPTPPQSYDPYAPTSNQSSLYSNGNPSPQTQSSHGTYLTTSQATYVPPVFASSPQPYNPYTPSSAPQATAPSYNAPYSAAPPTSYSATSTAPPPVPTPASPTTVSRPKLLNAYDPPFPTTKSKRTRPQHVTASAPLSAYATGGPTSPPFGGSHASPAFAQAPPVTEYIHDHNSATFRYEVPRNDPWHSGVITNGHESAVLGNAVEGLPPQSSTYAPPTWTSPAVTAEYLSAPESHNYSSIASAEITQHNPLHDAQDPEGGFEGEQASIAPPISHNDAKFSAQHSANGIVSPPSKENGSASTTSPPLRRVDSPSVRASPPPYVHHGGISSPLLSSTQRSSSPLSVAAYSSQASQNTTLYGPSQSAQLSSPYQRNSSPAGVPLQPSTTLHGSSNSYSVPTGPYQPNLLLSEERASSPASLSSRGLNGATAQYIPKLSNRLSNGYEQAYGAERASSPGSPSSLLNGSTSYVPPPRSGTFKSVESRHRTASNGSVLSAASNTEDPYAPSREARRQASESSDYGSYSSRFNYPEANSPYGSLSAQTYDAPQELFVTKPTNAPYAPSPSLLGSNDPLGRTAARVPVFSFGFGGKIVSCFHGASTLDTGFDVALTSRNSTGVHIRLLNKLIPDSALGSTAASYPGPLFSDPGSPTVSLVRPGASAQIKAKKARVLKYLNERVDELQRGIEYLAFGTIDRRQTEGKLVLVKLLKVMVENDGRLSGTPQIDSAVRTALVPRLAVDGGSPDVSNHLTNPLNVPQAVKSGSSIEMLSPSFSAISAMPNLGSSETPIAVSTLLPSTLNKIEDFLIRGDRRQAYHYALDEKLWAHAMVIASSIDREAWKEAVNDFLRNELGVASDPSRGTVTLRGTNAAPNVNGHEGLRVAYSLFSGQGSSAVQELVPQNLLSQATGSLPIPITSGVTPMTPNFAGSSGLNAPIESLAKWGETLAMMLTSPMSPETSAAVTALGDQLAGNQWIEAAHACYMLSPQTSPMSGSGNPAARIVLLGSRNPQIWPSFHKDPDSIVLTEVLEFALSLTPAVKGQEAFSGLPHLQAYRLFRALSLVEVGQTRLANRYCEAITASLGRSSPYFTAALLEQLKGLSDRLVGAPHIDKSGSWIGGKMSKPSLDTIGGWLEGRFTKLITGDGDSPIHTEESAAKKVDHTFGPFSHYSTISSATPSASPSPQPSVINHNVLPPPRRTGSAMASTSSTSPPMNVHPQIDRASSAMDHVRRRTSPAPRIASASAATSTFSYASSFGQTYGNHLGSSTYAPSEDVATPTTANNVQAEESSGQDVGWWGSSSYSETNSSQTPTASTFLRVDEGTISSSSDGFISLMDNASFSVGPTPSVSNVRQRSHAENDDEEDLGFGNSKKDKPASSNEAGSSSPAHAPEPSKPPPPRPELKQTTQSGSWFGSWFKRDSAPGPIKASLGEEKSFYYDKELKRWVNKKAGDAAPAPSAPPPPPSRAQTASPGMSGHKPPNSTSAGPPPARSASAIDLTTSPPSKSAIRIRSNLVPTPEDGSAPSSPTGSRLAPQGPLPGRPKSQASKRNVRSRYVDVFQAEDMQS